jgi:hypothetical protein
VSSNLAGSARSLRFSLILLAYLDALPCGPTAVTMAPAEKIRRSRVALAEVLCLLKTRSAVFMVKSSEDRRRGNEPEPVNRANERRVLG